MADPGNDWLLWARQMIAHHKSLVQEIQQYTEATARNTEAIARIGLLEERIKDLSVSHSATHNETKIIQRDLRLVADNLHEVESQCDTTARSTNRRVTQLEEQQGALLTAVERCKSQLETAIERQRHETPEWWMQQTYALTELKEYQRRENAERKKEINELRTLLEQLNQPCTQAVNAASASSAQRQRAASQSTPRRDTREYSYERHAQDATHPKELNEAPEGEYRAARTIMSNPLDLPQREANDTHASENNSTTGTEHSSTNEAEHTAPRRRRMRTRSQRAQAFTPDLNFLDDLGDQGPFSLDEFLLTRGDTIDSCLQAFEEKLVTEFINSMGDANQKRALVGRLDQTSWTWKSVKQEVMAICDEERKREEASERFKEATSTSRDELASDGSPLLFDGRGRGKRQKVQKQTQSASRNGSPDEITPVNRLTQHKGNGQKKRRKKKNW